MLCDHIEVWDRKGDTKGSRYRDICICMADSLCYKAEISTPVQNNYIPIKMFFKNTVKLERKMNTEYERVIEFKNLPVFCTRYV